VRGPALRADLALALLLWRGVLGRSGREPSRAELVAALGELRLPARVEIFAGDPPAVIDGAHTPESVEALRLALEEASFPRPRGLVLALASDKPPERILEKTLGLAETAVFTRADPVRGRDPRELQACWQRLGGADAHAVEEPLDALELASRGGRAVVVTGSFYLAGKLRKTVAERTG
jgi:dihydrofolate synthase/folylpolyglutamate synthase